MSVIEEQIRFQSGALELEGRLAYDEELSEPAAKVLICPPHPFLGGDMDNNVVSRLAQTLALAGFVVLRFNYRGIGQSQSDVNLNEAQQQFWEHSTCPDYEAKIHDDGQAAFAYLSDMLNSDLPVLLIGYSFGTLPALQISSAAPVKKLAIISPPLTKWQIEADLFAHPLNRSLFFSTNDFACPEESVQQLYKSLPEPKKLHRLVDADHFFIGQEQELADAVTGYFTT